MGFWKRIFRPESGKSDLDAEIESHLAAATADKCGRGATPEAARREAERDFGNVALVKDVTRSMWGWVWLEALEQDLTNAFHQLRRSRGFSITVIATLALGIGAATAMFTVVDHVLLRPLPYPHPERLVTIDETSIKSNPYLNSGATYLDLKQWQEQNHTFEQIAFYGGGAGLSNFLEGNGGSVQVDLVNVSPNFFHTLGIGPRLGHGFEENAEPLSGGKNANTIILSNYAWQQMYGGDSTILGKEVLLNGQAYTVVGVMPGGFVLGDRWKKPEVWTAVQLDKADWDRNNRRNYTVIGRLKPGISQAAAGADLKTLQSQISKNYRDPDVRETRASVVVRGYADSLVKSDLRKALLALLAAAGVLWLIACVNVINLFLVRASRRRREIAVRGALGASRGRIVQQLVAEGLVLSGAASILGTLLALAVIKIFEKQIPPHLPIQVSGTVNITILAVLIGLTLLSTVFSSVWPSLLAARAPIEPALRQGGQQSGTNRRQHRLRSGLVIAEIAMSLTLLVACGLLLRTIYALRHVPLGFRTDHIIVANLTIPSYRFTNRNLTTDLYQPLLQRVQHLPGVQAAALMTEVPLGQTFHMRLTLVGKSFGGLSSQNGTITSNFRAASPDVQQVFGFSMLKGRYFNAHDTAGSQPVAVVNRTFAHQYAPNPQEWGSILGMHLLNMRKDQPIVVVGVLDDARQSSIAQPQPEVEICIPQMTPDSLSYLAVEGRAMDLALRTQRPLAASIPELRSVLRQASPELAGATFTTMDQVVQDSYGSQTLAAHLLVLFGGAALLLCIAGIYGLLAYVVTQRTREIGVRVALGAKRGDVQWLVLRQAGMLVVAGVVLGTALAIASGRLVRSFLYGVKEHDAWTLIAVALLLLLSGGLAAYFPARKAATVDPIEALRTE